MKKMKENLVWATGYNALAIPVAAGLLSSFGIFLRPELAALIMAASSIIVVTNAVFLKREELLVKSV
jgi:Cu2+-exporting ATPase